MTASQTPAEHLRRHAFLGRLIWVLDLTAYAALTYAGAQAIWATSEYVSATVVWAPAIAIWGTLLLVGSAGCLLGRLTRLWAIEYVSNVLAGWGAWLYVIILIPAMLEGTSGVLFGFAVFASLGIARRYAELRIFVNEPGLSGIRARLEAAFRRRTELTVQRR